MQESTWEYEIVVGISHTQHIQRYRTSVITFLISWEFDFLHDMWIYYCWCKALVPPLTLLS